MFSAMTIILAVLGLLYIGYIVGEHFYYANKRKKIGLIIHVNGIRGKSTVTRLIDAGLRGCGYAVFSKTTGTVPTKIGVDNQPQIIKRWGPANVREQMRVLNWATKQKAHALVVECMAVNPELQYLTENRILHADINVITNVRADHLDQMGEDLESIAYSLANTTPKNGILVLGEDKYLQCFERCAQKQNTRIVVAKPYEGEENLDTFPENIATALAVCEALGLDKEKFFEGMRGYIHDEGSLSAYETGSTLFINALSANDPESTLAIYGKITEKYPCDEICVLLNSRPDRPFRIDQHVEMLKSMKFGKLIVTGSSGAYVARKLKKAGITAVNIKKTEELLGEKIIFACGNIAGLGFKLIDYFKTKGTQIKL